MTWRNWSGLATADPTKVLAPATPEQVAEAVRDAARSGHRVRMHGTGHSFTDVAVTDGVHLQPHRLSGVVAVDRRAMTVTALAGTTLHELNARLEALGLALHNMGDVDPQTLAGAVSTGTHGTGGVTASLSGQLEALQLVTADGELRTVDRDHDPELFHAARVGLGAVGVITALTFRVEPAFHLHAVEQPMAWEELLERHSTLVEGHHHVDAYWFPHTDRCLVKTNDRTLEPPAPLSRRRAWVEDELLSNTAFGAVDRFTTRFPRTVPTVNRLTARGWGAREYVDLSHRVFVASRRVVFREMEYSLPREQGMAVLRQARRLIERQGWKVAWPVEIRATPPDEAWLSSTYGRDSVYLAFHVGQGVDHRPYFTGVERLLREHDGRPHWGKLHTRTAADLAPAYPRWADFAAVRDRADPERLFANDYVERVLG